MDFLDYKYAMLVSSRLERFHDTGNQIYSFRCPLCHDSHRDKKKTRGYFIPSKKGGTGYYCHNCGASSSLGTFLKTVAGDLYTQYKVEKFGKTMGVKGDSDNAIEEKLKTQTTAKTFADPLGRCQRLSKCSVDLQHIKDYAISRKLPEDLFGEIFAAQDVNVITGRIEKYKETKYPKSPMLVIPFFRPDGSYSYIQCRVADHNAPDDFRFLTLQLNDDGPKLYGENHVDWNEPVFILEGPIDAMFIDNGLANAGASTSMGYVIEHVTLAKKPLSNIVMLFDNDYSRNPDIMKHVTRSIQSGFSVMLFDDEFKGLKDINKAITSGWSAEDINLYVRKRTFSGLRATLEVSKVGKRY